MVDKDFNIHIKETGSDGVVSAFDRIDAAADEAGKSVTDLGNKATQSGGKMAKLGETLKAGAGQAAGAAAASVGLATALNQNLSPAASQGIGALSAFAGVASAFGPWGQLVAAGASLAATAIALLSDNTEEAEEDTRSLMQQWREGGKESSFFAQSLGQVADAFDKVSTAANTAKAAQDAFAAGVGTDFALVPQRFIAAGVDAQANILATTATIGVLRKELADLQADGGASMTASAYTSALAATEAEIERQQVILRGWKSNIDGINAAAKAAADAAKAVPTPSPPTSGGRPTPGGMTLEDIARETEAARAVIAAAFDALRDEELAALYQTASVQVSDLAKKMEAELGALNLGEAISRAADPFANMSASASANLQRIREEGELTAEQYTQLGDTLSQFGGAAESAFKNAAMAALQSGESFMAVLNQQLEALAFEAGWQALKATAVGLFYTATGNLPGASLAFASAATWAALTAASAVGAAVTSGASGGGGGASGGGGGSSAGGQNDPSRDLGPSGGSSGGGPTTVTYVIQNSGVVGLDRDLDRRFSRGQRNENRRPNGVRNN